MIDHPFDAIVHVKDIEVQHRFEGETAFVRGPKKSQSYLAMHLHGRIDKRAENSSSATLIFLCGQYFSGQVGFTAEDAKVRRVRGD